MTFHRIQLYIFWIELAVNTKYRETFLNDSLFIVTEGILNQEQISSTEFFFWFTQIASISSSVNIQPTPKAVGRRGGGGEGRGEEVMQEKKSKLKNILNIFKLFLFFYYYLIQ